MPCQEGTMRLDGHERVSAVGRDKVLVQMANSHILSPGGGIIRTLSNIITSFYFCCLLLCRRSSLYYEHVSSALKLLKAGLNVSKQLKKANSGK